MQCHKICWKTIKASHQKAGASWIWGEHSWFPFCRLGRMQHVHPKAFMKGLANVNAHYSCCTTLPGRPQEQTSSARWAKKKSFQEQKLSGTSPSLLSQHHSSVFRQKFKIQSNACSHFPFNYISRVRCSKVTSNFRKWNPWEHVQISRDSLQNCQAKLARTPPAQCFKYNKLFWLCVENEDLELWF